MSFAVAIHGGAGAVPDLDPALERSYVTSLESHLDLAQRLLQQGVGSLDVVQAVICALEDDPLFNAGRGAVYTEAGTHELDSALMDGRTLAFGGVACLSGFANPVLVARGVMERTPHLLLAGEGARRLAIELGLQEVQPEYFATPRRLRQLELARKHRSVILDHASVAQEQGTVGVVARDRGGDLAAGSSTGGMTNKRRGRVGDSPLPGAGLYADNRTCAVTCTGLGEEFMRQCVAHRVSDLMELCGLGLAEACHQVVHALLQPGQGGLVAVDHEGNLAACFNSTGMFRALADSAGLKQIAIW